MMTLYDNSSLLISCTNAVLSCENMILEQKLLFKQSENVSLRGKAINLLKQQQLRLQYFLSLGSVSKKEEISFSVLLFVNAPF